MGMRMRLIGIAGVVLAGAAATAVTAPAATAATTTATTTTNHASRDAGAHPAHRFCGDPGGGMCPLPTFCATFSQTLRSFSIDAVLW